MLTDEWLYFEFLELDNETKWKQEHRMNMREKNDPFVNLDDAEFINRYRLSKTLAKDLCNEIRPFFNDPVRISALSVETKLLTALSFYASGSYQKPTGDISEHGLSQPSVSRVLNEVTSCLNTPDLIEKYIHFPKTRMERNHIRSRFYAKHKFPGVLGCIGCAHIAIIKPQENPERYYCNENYHTLNVQLVCDADMQITSAETSFGGATHSSVIWEVHPLRGHMENLNKTESTWFLGDSGYPLRPYLLTPFIGVDPGTVERRHYTVMHSQTRNLIDQTIADLKARFRCLLPDQLLHYQPPKAAAIVNACIILHNICNKAGLPVPDLSDEDLLHEAQMQCETSAEPCSSISSNRIEYQEGVLARNRVVRRLWDARAVFRK